MSSCECWIPAVTSAVTLVLYALLLLALYIMLSRKIAQHSRGMQASSSPGEHPSAHPSPAPAVSPGGDKAQQPQAQQPQARQPGAQNPAPAYAGSSDTSSDTSEDSEGPPCPQVPGAQSLCQNIASPPASSLRPPEQLQGPGSEENLNYTSLVFLGKGREPGSARDYENMKAGMDYVNVDPKKRKRHVWPFSSPRACKAVEYTEVKL